MERRRAIAWAGSIALMGGVTALVVGSTLGGFGLGISRAPQIQVIGPGPTPQTTQQAPAPDAPQLPPVPGTSAPDPDPAPGDSALLATTKTAVPAAPDAAREIKDYPREPAAHPKSPEIVVVSPLAETGPPPVPAPPREVNRPDMPAEKKKAPSPIFDKRPDRDGPITDRQKRAAELARIRAILERVPDSRVGRAGPSGDHDAPPSGRLRGPGTKAGAAEHHPRGRNNGRDG